MLFFQNDTAGSNRHFRRQFTCVHRKHLNTPLDILLPIYRSYKQEFDTSSEGPLCRETTLVQNKIKPAYLYNCKVQTTDNLNLYFNFTVDAFSGMHYYYDRQM